MDTTINILLQNIGVWLVLPMQGFSFLGSEQFYLILLSFLYWCVDSRLGFRVGMLLMFSTGINRALKFSFHSPRPYWIDPNVKAFIGESSFGLPSGHSQNAAGIWGMAAAVFRQRWTTVFMIGIAIMIGLSRIYLGVHFWLDVAAGWFIGILVLFFFLTLENKMTEWLKTHSLLHQMIACWAVTLLVLAIQAFPRQLLNDWNPPHEWVVNASNSISPHTIDPLNPDAQYTTGGTLLGMSFGASWYYSKKGRWYLPVRQGGKMALCYGIGMVILFILWFGLGIIFPRDGTILSYSLRFIRYGFMGLWVTALAPMLFEKIFDHHNPV